MLVTIEELAKHNSKEDLWLAVDGKVYNCTQFQNRHPAGAAILLKVAGTDATQQFLKFHPTRVLHMLSDSDHVGSLLPQLTMEEVSKHNTPEDLWVVVDGQVYDCTAFQARHPGGSKILQKVAGTDATKEFLKFHRYGVLKMLHESDKLGPVVPKLRARLASAQEGIPLSEVAKHNTKDDLWVAVDGQVYNLTEFQKRHPGGAPILQKVAGTDATKQFLKFHPTDVIRMLKNVEKLGPLLASDIAEDTEAPTESERQLQKFEKAKPPLGEMLNLFDFELVASKTLERTAWYYYSSAADDEITMRENHRAYQRIFFRPRVLVNVSKVDTTAKFFGRKSSLPIYITATALARLGHPDGEIVLTRAAAKEGIPQMLSTLASCSVDEVCDAKTPEQDIWLQVYVNSDRQVTREFIQNAEKRGICGFFVTVDAPQLGRREKDMRGKYDEDLADVQGDEDEDADRSQGAARAISSFIDPALSWKDIPFLRKCTKKPLVIKGVQRWEDVLKAAKAGFDGAVISNHGGRQLEFAPPPVEILAESMYHLRKAGLHRKFEVYVDGGIRRGTDVMKALCLGARGVGIGRPFLYAMSTYGEEGVRRAIQLLNDEIIMNMRLLGVRSLDELGPSLLDVRSRAPVARDYTYEAVYEKLVMPEFKL